MRLLETRNFCGFISNALLLRMESQLCDWQQVFNLFTAEIVQNEYKFEKFSTKYAF